ncbi:MAG: hypothetical protein EBQ66_11725 [Flavobacteriia bacterium]|nr:hypothetical protein [Flavobacteriia bacterium]
MIILFYSEECNFCSKLIEYLEKNNLKKNFNFINIDRLAKIPDHITMVPTIIDPKVEAPLEGKKAFEHIINQKYFDHPTNNIEYWINNSIPKPIIEEDSKAIERHNFGFANFDEQQEKKETTKIDVKSVVNNKVSIIKDKKMLALMKLRK